MLLSMPLNDVHASALRRSGSRPLHAYIKAPSPARLAATTYGFDPSSQQPPATPRLSSYPVGQGGVRPLLLPGRYAASAGAPTRPPAPGGGNGGASGEELELLWAGYSHMQEELRAMHAKCEALQHQLSSVTERLAEASRKQLAPSERWQAASFLLFVLGVINVFGMLQSLPQPFWVAKQQGSLWVKELVCFALPLTNSACLIIFCVQAIKAAWQCLRW